MLYVQQPPVEHECFEAKLLTVAVKAWHLTLQKRLKVVHALWRLYQKHWHPLLVRLLQQVRQKLGSLQALLVQLWADPKKSLFLRCQLLLLKPQLEVVQVQRRVKWVRWFTLLRLPREKIPTPKPFQEYVPEVSRFTRCWSPL